MYTSDYGAESNHHFQRYLVESVGVGAGGEDVIEIFCSTYRQLILGDLFTPGTQSHKKDPLCGRELSFLPFAAPLSLAFPRPIYTACLSTPPVDISAFFPFLLGTSVSNMALAAPRTTCQACSQIPFPGLAFIHFFAARKL